MSAGAKSRLAEAIAAATSSDGRRIDRARLAELLETRADDPLLLIVEVACLAAEGETACRDSIHQGVIYLDHRLREGRAELASVLDKHRACVQAAEQSIGAASGALRAEQQATRRDWDGRLQRLERAAAEIGKQAGRVEGRIAAMEEKPAPVFCRKVWAAFAVGLCAGILFAGFMMSRG